MIRPNSLTLTLTSSNYYMSPLSLSAYNRPTDILRHFMYSLPNLPRVRDLFLHWKSLFCWHLAGGGEGPGTERNGFLSFLYFISPKKADLHLIIDGYIQ